MLSIGPISLATAMREGSMAEHEAAESSSYMSELLGGRLAERGYVEYLLRLRVVYAALEETIRAQADDPLVAAVHDPALERLAAIDADLAQWATEVPGAVPGGEQGVADGAEYPVDSPAAHAYAERVRSASWGGALVAHHYTRYLGDLSGGQAIGRILDRSFELDGAGIAFYDFTEIPKPKPYKDRYRASLDALDLALEDVVRVVDEVKVAFGLNQALFTELGSRLDDYRR